MAITTALTKKNGDLHTKYGIYPTDMLSWQIYEDWHSQPTWWIQNDGWEIYTVRGVSLAELMGILWKEQYLAVRNLKMIGIISSNT